MAIPRPTLLELGQPSKWRAHWCVVNERKSGGESHNNQGFCKWSSAATVFRDGDYLFTIALIMLCVYYSGGLVGCYIIVVFVFEFNSIFRAAICPRIASITDSAFERERELKMADGWGEMLSQWKLFFRSAQHTNSFRVFIFNCPGVGAGCMGDFISL